MNKDEINKIIQDSKRSGELKPGSVSDGYHTFDELYEFRKVYNAALFNEWYASGRVEVYKTYRDSEGNLFDNGDWFLVVAILPTGQISNHYAKEDFELFKIPEEPQSPYEFDGHTPQDVLQRIRKFETEY